jgi:hypothetical protein
MELNLAQIAVKSFSFVTFEFTSGNKRKDCNEKQEYGLLKNPKPIAP